MSRVVSWIALIACTFALEGLAVSKSNYAGVTPKNASEETVIAFLDLAFNQKRFDEAFERYVGPAYRQHNPTVADGKEAILAALRQWMPATPSLQYIFRKV
jgi:predicted SnoaL-like aldol condensation-catalyzing enzyme